MHFDYESHLSDLLTVVHSGEDLHQLKQRIAEWI